MFLLKYNTTVYSREYKTSEKECMARLLEVKKDFETINKWVTEFISNSMSEGFRKNILPDWEEYAKGVDKTTFTLSDFSKSERKNKKSKRFDPVFGKK